MASNPNHEFHFIPRPEAHATQWDALLPPVRDAVRDLLLRIDGATDDVEKKKADDTRNAADMSRDVANCFLVYGDRGTGKSTVLLSAQDALDHGEGFFRATNDVAADLKKQSAMDCAWSLRKKSVVWLDVLDLEPLPPKANLLTTVLTCVRDALDINDGGTTNQGPTSLFEESADSARHKLHQLINDATLMWEDISEEDTRSKANRQVAAADIYAHFRKQFVEALCALSRELGQQRNGRGTECPIVLPIDNIDRSTDHLHAIVKLAQMVDCRYLWLIMAGDRLDVDTFLERAYWKELIRTQEGAVASGKSGPKGEDESFAMARRQGAAASQKLLPPSHRVEVHRVLPKDTLNFCPAGNGHPAGVGDGAPEPENMTIAALLGEIPIPVENQKARRELYFMDLFDAGGLLSRHEETKTPKQDKKADASDESDRALTHLTSAAQYGLWLPARGVLDLWQLAHWVFSDRKSFPADERPDLRAEKIARTMLRNVIAPSKMTSELGKLIQDQIVRRNVHGGTILNFDECELRILRSMRAASQFRLRWQISVEQHSDQNFTTNQSTVRSGLTLFDIIGHVIKFKWGGQPPHDGDSGVGVHEEELPHLVLAWLMILHDILVWAEKSAVANSKPIPTAPVVMASHEVVPRPTEVKSLRWPAPKWNAYLAHDVFRQRWKQTTSIVVPLQPPGQVVVKRHLFRVLVVAWIECVLNTYLTFVSDISLDADFRERSLTKRLADVTRKKSGAKGTAGAAELSKEDVKKFEHNVMQAACRLYKAIRTQKKRVSTQPGVSVVDDRTDFMTDWFERKLPLLFTQLYVPMDDSANKNRRKFFDGLLDPSQPLYQCWLDEAPFFLDEMDQELAKLFPAKRETKKAGQGETEKADPPRSVSWKQLGAFGDLHRAMKKPADEEG